MGGKMFVEKGAGEVYEAILAGLRERVGRGMVVVEEKQTCVHIVAGKGAAAYAGLHPRKGAVLMTIVASRPLKSKRVRKAEQRSKNRAYCDVLVSSVGEVDEELMGWLEGAVELVRG